MQEMRKSLEEQMKEVMDAMQKIDPSSNEYKMLVSNLVDLTRIRNEALKIECDYERQAENLDVEAKTKESQLDEERKQFKTKWIIECAKIGVSVLLFAGLAFAESRSTFTNLSTKNLFSGMKFGLKN